MKMQNEITKQVEEIHAKAENGQATLKDVRELKNIKKEMEKEAKNKKTPEERKELAVYIIKLICEIILQFLALGVPMLTKGKTIMKF